MDYKEYKEQKRVLIDKMHQIERDMKLLDRRFINELPIKQGDKIEITGYGVGWLKSIIMTAYGLTTVYFYPPKKDGTMSNRVRCAYHIRLENIKRM